MNERHDKYVAGIAKSLDGLSDEDAAKTMAALLEKTPDDPFVRDHMRKFFRQVDAMRRARRTLGRCWSAIYSLRADD